jgi:hypothetical protein
LLKPWAVAVNCFVPDKARVAVDGETESTNTATAALADEALLLLAVTVWAPAAAGAV